MYFTVVKGVLLKISYGSSDTEAVVPSTVKVIKPNVFAWCKVIKKVTLPEGLVSIQKGAFSHCESLESINLPKGLKEIGENAFYKCKSLKTVILPEGISAIGEDAFAECTSLTRVATTAGGRISEAARGVVIDLKNSLNPGSGLFRGCTSLEQAALPDSCTLVPNFAFADCKKLRDLRLPRGMYRVGKNAFENCRSITKITLPMLTMTISDSAFRGCENLDRVYFGPMITEIGSSAFFGCSKLKSVSLPGSIESIAANAFEKCCGIRRFSISEDNAYYEVIDDVLFSKDKKRIVRYPTGRKTDIYHIPDGVESIGGCAFESAQYLKKIVLPNSVREICDKGFAKCISLVTAELDPSLTRIGDGAFDCDRELKNITLPDSLEYLGCGAFMSCESIRSVVIPRGITVLRQHVFCHCRGLLEVTLPETLEEIQEYAFACALSLKQIDIPLSVNMIYDFSFRDCKRLMTVTIPRRTDRDKKSDVGRKAFIECPNLTTLNIAGYTFNVEKSFAMQLTCYGVSSLKRIVEYLDFDGLESREFKVYIAVKMLLEITEPDAPDWQKKQKPAVEKYIKNIAVSLFMQLIDNNDYLFIKYIITRGDLLDEHNIDKICDHAIANAQNGGSHEIQVLLANYRTEKLSGGDLFSELRL